MMEIDSPHPQGIYCIISGHRNCFLEEPRKYLFGHSHTKPIDIFLFFSNLFSAKHPLLPVNHIKKSIFNHNIEIFLFYLISIIQQLFFSS